MTTFIFTCLALVAATFCGWFYWQIQRMEERLKQREAQVNAQATLVGELADEISMASDYLYEAMDRCLARMESLRPVVERSEEQTMHHQEQPVTNSAPTIEPEPDMEEQEWWTEEMEIEHRRPVEPTYHPHFQALEMANQGMEPMDIARHTGLGVEELRLLLRFQEELSLAN